MTDASEHFLGENGQALDGRLALPSGETTNKKSRQLAGEIHSGGPEPAHPTAEIIVVLQTAETPFAFATRAAFD